MCKFYEGIVKDNKNVLGNYGLVKNKILRYIMSNLNPIVNEPYIFDPVMFINDSNYIMVSQDSYKNISASLLSMSAMFNIDDDYKLIFHDYKSKHDNVRCLVEDDVFSYLKNSHSLNYPYLEIVKMTNLASIVLFDYILSYEFIWKKSGGGNVEIKLKELIDILKCFNSSQVQSLDNSVYTLDEILIILDGIVKDINKSTSLFEIKGIDSTFSPYSVELKVI